MPKIKEITRAGAELDITRLNDWFIEYESTISNVSIQPQNLWNFDKTPLQLGWVNHSPRIFSTRMRRSTRPIVFQPGNKESLTSVDAINAAGRSIPSFLILEAKVLLEEYTFAQINTKVVLTYTDSGFNNDHRALQWLQHFNRHSFAASPNFKDHTIESWFGYGASLTRARWNEGLAFAASKMTRKSNPVHRLLLMDGFSAHENPEFIWYCFKFDIIPHELPSHTSHLMQPLDVGVYQHLKHKQRHALTDFISAGGLQMTRFEFLGQWDRLYKAAFMACHIYAGFEKAGIWPVNKDLILGPLY